MYYCIWKIWNSPESRTCTLPCALFTRNLVDSYLVFVVAVMKGNLFLTMRRQQSYTLLNMDIPLLGCSYTPHQSVVLSSSQAMPRNRNSSLEQTGGLHTRQVQRTTPLHAYARQRIHLCPCINCRHTSSFFLLHSGCWCAVSSPRTRQWRREMQDLSSLNESDKTGQSKHTVLLSQVSAHRQQLIRDLTLTATGKPRGRHQE